MMQLVAGARCVAAADLSGESLAVWPSSRPPRALSHVLSLSLLRRATPPCSLGSPSTPSSAAEGRIHQSPA